MAYFCYCVNLQTCTNEHKYKAIQCNNGASHAYILFQGYLNVREIWLSQTSNTDVSAR